MCQPLGHKKVQFCTIINLLHHSMNIPAEALDMATNSHYLWWKVTNILPEFSTIYMYIVMYVTSLNCSENVMKKGVLKQELTFKLSSVPSILTVDA